MKISIGLLSEQIDSSEQANTANTKPLICYNCGKPGHKAPECKEPKRQQANQANSTGRRRGDNNRSGGRGHGKNRNKRGRGGGRNYQQANASQENSKHDAIVHGCSARVIDFSLTSDTSGYHNIAPSPISLWEERIKVRFLSESCYDSPEEIDSFEPYYVTWCINIADVFTSKMELVSPKSKYGNTWDDLDVPLVVLSDIIPFSTEGMRYTSIVRPGTHRSAGKRTRQMFKVGLLPALETAFGIVPAKYPVCYQRWHQVVYDWLHYRLMHDNHHYNRPAIINCDTETLFLCFCPDRAATPSISVSENNVHLSSRDMQRDYELSHTLFLDYDSPLCWNDPAEFWDYADEGYGAVPIPYAWQPYYSDLDSQLTHITLSESTQPEPSDEGTVTVDASLSRSSSLVSENYSDDSQNRFFRRQYRDTDPPHYFDVRIAASAITVQLADMKELDDTENVASCSDSDKESMDDIEEFDWIACTNNACNSTSLPPAFSHAVKITDPSLDEIGDPAI